MRFVDRNDDGINNFDEWADRGKPASERHWVEGRSAYEFAADWIERDAAERARQVLAAGRDFDGIEFLEGVVEKKTRFDSDPRGPRNHDLLIRARISDAPVVIGVEGKADEPFDDPLWRWRQKARQRTETTGAPARLDKLTQLFLGTTIDTDDTYPPAGCIGYQLVSGLAGTLADAKTYGATRAVFLVHEFITDKTEDEKHEANSAVLDDFLQRVSKGGVVRHEVDVLGWITEPVAVAGDGRWMPTTLPVSFAKLVTNLRRRE